MSAYQKPSQKSPFWDSLYIATHPKMSGTLARFQLWATRLMGLALIYFGIELILAKL